MDVFFVCWGAFRVRQLGWTPLMCAAAGGYRGIGRLLLNRGARLDAKDHVSCWCMVGGWIWGRRELPFINCREQPRRFDSYASSSRAGWGRVGDQWPAWRGPPAVYASAVFGYGLCEARAPLSTAGLPRPPSGTPVRFFSGVWPSGRQFCARLGNLEREDRDGSNASGLWSGAGGKTTCKSPQLAAIQAAPCRAEVAVGADTTALRASRQVGLSERTGHNRAWQQPWQANLLRAAKYRPISRVVLIFPSPTLDHCPRLPRMGVPLSWLQLLAGWRMQCPCWSFVALTSTRRHS